MQDIKDAGAPSVGKLPLLNPNEDELGEEEKIPSSSDSRVSWIYRLRKEELIQELDKFRLSTTGTMEERRKRLLQYIRDGQLSPQPPRSPSPCIFPTPMRPGDTAPPLSPQPTVAPNIRVPSTLQLSPQEVRKWNIHFDEEEDPAAFLERLAEICEYSQIELDRLLPVLPELLRGNPMLWYRNNRKYWNNWTDFVESFRTFYFPVNYLEDIEAEISRRLQLVHEPVTAYLTDLQTLIRRHGSITPEQELRWLYRNLLPEYRQYIRKADFRDVPSLTAKAKEFELLQAELMGVRQPKIKASPEKSTTRYEPRTASSEQRHPPGPSHARGPSDAQNRDHRLQRSPPFTPRNTPLSPGRNKTATPNRTSGHGPLCWRCGKLGHVRSECRSPPKVFCSRCGRQGVLSRDCKCNQSEN